MFKEVLVVLYRVGEMHALYFKLKLCWHYLVGFLACALRLYCLNKTVVCRSPRSALSPGQWLLGRLLHFDYLEGGFLSDGLLKSKSLPFGGVSVLVSSVPEPTFLLLDASLLLVYAIYRFGVLVVNVYQGRGFFDALAFLDVFD